jgi:hypothetical protein
MLEEQASVDVVARPRKNSGSNAAKPIDSSQVPVLVLYSIGWSLPSLIVETAKIDSSLLWETVAEAQKTHSWMDDVQYVARHSVLRPCQLFDMSLQASSSSTTRISRLLCICVILHSAYFMLFWISPWKWTSGIYADR